MGSSKEKTKKKVEADVEFSTPIKFFFELSHLKTPVSRPLFFSNIAPRMRKSGPPPPGQRSISAFFGARPAAVAAAGAPAAAETKVCVFRRRCGFKRKKEKPPLFSVSRALTLCPDFNALSITDTSAETHRSRREDNGPTTRARTPSRERALSDALDQGRERFSNASAISISASLSVLTLFLPSTRSSLLTHSIAGRRRTPEGLGDGNRGPGQGKVGCRGHDDGGDDDRLCRRGDPPSRSRCCCCCCCCCSPASPPERRARRASGAQEGQEGGGGGGCSC